MTTLFPYLTFNGNCREAMLFYQRCLGTGKEEELYLQTLAGSPETTGLPPDTQQYIVHATLKTDRLVLMATDLVPEEGLKAGNRISLLIECQNEQELLALYERLSENGIRNYPPDYTTNGALFGGLTDRYGHQWLLRTC
jgi:PhnB protein